MLCIQNCYDTASYTVSTPKGALMSGPQNYLVKYYYYLLLIDGTAALKVCWVILLFFLISPKKLSNGKAEIVSKGPNNSTSSLKWHNTWTYTKNSNPHKSFV